MLFRSAKTTVIVPLKYQRKIVKFAIDEQVKPAEINHDNKTIKVIVKVGTNLKNLNPVIELSEASSVYAPLNHHDFSAPIKYTVTSPACCRGRKTAFEGGDDL